MKKSTWVITFLILISASLTLLAEYRGPVQQIWFFKPMTMILIIGMALQKARNSLGFYRIGILAGLVCCLAGDVFLMFPDYFVQGLFCFLVGHLWFTAAFFREKTFQWNTPRFSIFLFYGIGVFLILFPSLGKLTTPVAFYILVILIMGWQALDRWEQNRQIPSFLAFLGAMFFILSDSILAFNKFHTPFVAGRALNLSFYFLAQYLIASSIDIRSSFFYSSPAQETENG